MNSSKRGPVYGFKLQSLESVTYYIDYLSGFKSDCNVYLNVKTAARNENQR